MRNDCAKELLIESYRESDKNGRFDEASRKYKICYLKYAINPTGKSVQNHNGKKDKTKYLVNEVLEKFNQALRILNITEKEAFLQHHALGYVKATCSDYGNEPTAVSENIISVFSTKLSSVSNQLIFLCMRKKRFLPGNIPIYTERLSFVSDKRRHGCLRFKNWFIDSGFIALGS